MLLAQLRPAYESGLAQFRSAYSDDAVSITVITNIDAGNIDPATVSILNAASASPTVTVAHRTAAGNWRHFLFAVENAVGKTPIFRMTMAGRAFSGSSFTTEFLPHWTTDFVTWHSAPSRTIGTYMQWTFTEPLPAGRVYVASSPMGRQADAVLLRDELLTSYSTIAAPAASANALTAIYATTPAETDDLGRAVGGNPQYAVKLAWGGATTDGKRKRKLVMFAGMHSAGEHHSWYPFKSALAWMLDSASPEAVAFRSNWDVWLYWNVTPNGLLGGSSRLNFRTSTDPNRSFVLSGSGGLTETNNLRAAVEDDLGGAADALLSWHGSARSSIRFIVTLMSPDYDAGTRSPIVQAFIDEGIARMGATEYVDYSSITGSDFWWAREKLGAKISFPVECQYRGNTSLAEYTLTGESWIQSLQAVDAQGLFLPPIDLAGASLVATTATGSLTTGIALAGSASSMTLADGVLTIGIRLRGDALAGAIAAAGLTTAIRLAASAQAGAQASGTLTTAGAIDLAGNAQAAALAAGSITAIIRFEAAAIAKVLGAGTLTAPGAPSQLAADATVLAIAEGGLTTGINLRGAAASVVQASGTLDLALTFDAAAFASVLASGVLSTQVRMDSAAVASVLAAARLSTTQDAYRSARLMDVAGSRQMRVPRGRTMQFARLP